MREFIFGVMPKKTVTIYEDGRITLEVKMFNDGEIQADEIVKIYHKEATLMTNGEIYLSPDGINNPLTLQAPTGFIYSRKQRKDVDELLELIDVYAGEEVSTRMVGSSSTSYQPKEKKKVNRNAVKCPKCKSINVDFMGNDKKSFSVGKAVGGAVLTGGIGTLAGFAGKKGKNQWHCKDCGNVFKKK